MFPAAYPEGLYGAVTAVVARVVSASMLLIVNMVMIIDEKIEVCGRIRKPQTLNSKI